MMNTCKPTVRIQAADFDSAREVELLTKGQSDLGAVVTFTGICRDEGGKISSLDIEHYPGMAEAELERVALEAAERWPLIGITVVHRHGRIRPGDNIVLVVTASLHRQAAFESAEFLMDFLKTKAPFWKKAQNSDGSEGEWIEAKIQDDQAAERWK